MATPEYLLVYWFTGSDFHTVLLVLYTVVTSPSRVTCMHNHLYHTIPFWQAWIGFGRDRAVSTKKYGFFDSSVKTYSGLSSDEEEPLSSFVFTTYNCLPSQNLNCHRLIIMYRYCTMYTVSLPCLFVCLSIMHNDLLKHIYPTFTATKL